MEDLLLERLQQVSKELEAAIQKRDSLEKEIVRMDNRISQSSAVIFELKALLEKVKKAEKESTESS